MAKKRVALGERAFMELIEKFAKKSGAAITRERGRLIVRSSDGVTDYSEIAPAFHETYWAAWWAFRLLHPDKLITFDMEMRKLFEDYKANGSAKKWAGYNDDKRLLLERYLREPYAPAKKRKRK